MTVIEPGDILLLKEVGISDFRKATAMTTIVKMQRKGQVTIPTRLRAEVGLVDGDWVEARAHRGKIVLTPKLVVDREYTPAQRRIINARLAQAEADITAGRVSKTFSNHTEFIAELHKASAKLDDRRTKHRGK